MFSHTETLNISGAWLQSIGTLIVAVAETEYVNNQTPIYDLIIIGNSFQGIGNSLQGFAGILQQPESDPISILGSFTQASGNATGVYSAALNIQSLTTKSQDYNILGSSLQSLGAGLEASSESTQSDPFSLEITIGYSLQSLGAGLEAIGGLYVKKSKSTTGNLMTLIGSYLQFYGATIAAIAITKQALTPS
ncbi:DUF6944 family repetitive protein [Bacillus alkalisoli]|uniref:DUF6944 family repetitive protein n=1 Tax=Bacillus alkalisoli TaxID=2011008 RepID=UPI000C2450B2|nr:hypothetical protein [Bacillus alkalisoli]